MGSGQLGLMATESDPAKAPATDAEIVIRSWSHPEIFAEIFERHFPVIHRYLARRVGSALADDLAAEAFTIAFERRRTFHPGAHSARPWLFGIATNLIRTNRPSERRFLAALAELSRQAAISTPSDMDDAKAAAEAIVDMPRVARALAGLKSNQRDVLLLHYWADLTHAEIALSLRISPGTVASRLARARRRAQLALADPPTDVHPKFTRS
jgi:RNA polymerase sigma factor (sigma-70 family)